MRVLEQRIVKKESLIDTALDLFMSMLQPIISPRFQKNNLEAHF